VRHPSFSSLRSELEILQVADSFGMGGRLNSEMVADYCRNGWTILSEYAVIFGDASVAPDQIVQPIK